MKNENPDLGKIQKVAKAYDQFMNKIFDENKKGDLEIIFSASITRFNPKTGETEGVFNLSGSQCSIYDFICHRDKLTDQIEQMIKHGRDSNSSRESAIDKLAKKFKEQNERI